MKNAHFSFMKRMQSFKFAFHGIELLVSDEHNFRIHIVATCCVIFTAWFLHCTTIEWLILLLHIGIILTVEAVNSIIERIADYVSPEKNKAIGKIKDISAAAVLISAFVACISGGIIFIPKLLNLLFN